VSVAETASTVGERLTELPTLSPRLFRRLLRRPLAFGAIVFLAAVVIVAVVAPLVLPGVAHEQAGNLLDGRQGPSWRHLLGTDQLGRDLLDRLLVGTRVTMVGVAEGLATVLVIGLPLGLAAGYLGGWVDRAASRLIHLSL
jgi:peptide/nickel transport system permease protein